MKTDLTPSAKRTAKRSSDYGYPTVLEGHCRPLQVPDGPLQLSPIFIARCFQYHREIRTGRKMPAGITDDQRAKTLAALFTRMDDDVTDVVIQGIGLRMKFYEPYPVAEIDNCCPFVLQVDLSFGPDRIPIRIRLTRIDRVPVDRYCFLFHEIDLAYINALKPVMAFPTMSVCISRVPS